MEGVGGDSRYAFGAVVSADLSGCKDVGLGLDCAGAEQCFPVCGAGTHGEG